MVLKRKKELKKHKANLEDQASLNLGLTKTDVHV